MNEQKNSSRFGAADIFMLAACFLWALGTVICKKSFGNTPDTFRVMIFNNIRFILATALLFMTLKLTGSPLSIKREDIPRFAVISFFGSFLFIVAFHIGLSRTTASNTGIIMALIPLVIVLMSFLLRVEKPSKWLVTGILMGTAGVILMNYRDGIITFNSGDLLVLLSCFSWGIYAVYGEKILEQYPPLLVTAWIFLFTSLYHLPAAYCSLHHQSWRTIPPHNWLNLVFAAVGPLFIANALYFWAIQKVGPSRSGIYINLEPVFTVVLAYLISREHITHFQIIGLLVIIAGVGISKIQVQPSSATLSRNETRP